jgi:hypothetical protein
MLIRQSINIILLKTINCNIRHFYNLNFANLIDLKQQFMTPSNHEGRTEESPHGDSIQLRQLYQYDTAR